MAKYTTDKKYYFYNKLPKDFEVFDQNSSIYKYMKFEYLKSSLETKTFFISKKEGFKDKNEKKLPLQSSFSLHQAGQEITKAKLDEEFELWQKKQTEYIKSQNAPTSCWTYQTRENNLMWEAYTQTCGVRIGTTIDKFVLSLDTKDYDIFCGYMQYDGYGLGNTKNYEDCMFSKSQMYADEREFRFYFFPKESYNQDLKIDNLTLNIDNPIKLINEIIISPFVEHPNKYKTELIKLGMEENKIRISNQ